MHHNDEISIAGYTLSIGDEVVNESSNKTYEVTNRELLEKESRPKDYYLYELTSKSDGEVIYVASFDLVGYRLQNYL